MGYTLKVRGKSYVSVLDVKLWYSLSNFISLKSYQKVNNVGGLTLKYVLYNFSSILILEFYQIRDFFWKMKFIYTSFSVANYFLRIYVSFARTKKITFSSITLYLMNTQITVWKNEKFTLTWKIFRENSLYTCNEKKYISVEKQ